MTTTGNRLLDVLPETARERLIASARMVELPLRAQLYTAQALVTHVHFLTSGVASVVVSMAEGGSAEVAMIGPEGVVGGAGLLGTAPMEADCFMQIVGGGLRVPIRVMRTLFDENIEVRNCILQFVQSQMNIASQVSACNKLHEAEARLARWLLMAADRAGSETLGLTQEFLAQMLGSQRTTVALVAGILQRSGFIDYSRGRVRILNRDGLTAVACDCYGITRKSVESLYR